MNPGKIEKKFRELYNTSPRIFRSPGRINLIGEHTDYNDGFVMPAAIDKEVVYAVNITGSDKIRMFAFDLNEILEVEASGLKRDPKKWPDYLSGVVDQLHKAGYKVRGFDCVFGSDIPIGSGLSSSAALECGLAYALNELLDLDIGKMQLAKLCQKAEQEFAGLNCGIMDQFASLFGSQDQVMKLDCRSLEYEYYPLDLPDFEIILCDTRVKHSLASSEYNTRRKECEAGVRILKNYDKSIHSLRDVKAELLIDHKDQIQPIVYQRCLYVVEEIERVEKACSDLQKGNIEDLGKKMYQTHNGLSKMYGVSCTELDYLVEIALQSEVTGARMMGGGFGGCTINLVKKSLADQFVENIISGYKDKFRIDPLFYRVGINNGTSRLQ